MMTEILWWKHKSSQDTLIIWPSLITKQLIKCYNVAIQNLYFLHYFLFVSWFLKKKKFLFIILYFFLFVNFLRILSLKWISTNLSLASKGKKGKNYFINPFFLVLSKAYVGINLKRLDLTKLTVPNMHETSSCYDMTASYVPDVAFIDLSRF